MSIPELAHLRAQDGSNLATFAIEEVTDGWYCGTMLAASFPADLQEKLAWYDEVVTGQMLSLVDEARDGIDSFQLRIHFPDGESCPAVGLHVMASGEVCFRTTPIPPPAYTR